MCEMDNLDSDGSNLRPGITPASCVTMHNRHIFLRLGCGEVVVKLPYGLRAGMLSAQTPLSKRQFHFYAQMM